MKQIVEQLDPGLGKIVDLDCLPSGEWWAGIFDTGDGLVVRIGEVAFEAPAGLQFPMIRMLHPGLVVFVWPRISKVQDNAWIFGADGSLLSSFCAGDGIEDILASEDRIVFTYFDEGVFGDIPPSAQGLVAFDLEGRLVFEYFKDITRDQVDIADCYCAAWASDGRVVFSPYTGFPLVFLDLEARAQEATALPQKLHGATAPRRSASATGRCGSMVPIAPRSGSIAGPGPAWR